MRHKRDRCSTSHNCLIALWCIHSHDYLLLSRVQFRHTVYCTALAGNWFCTIFLRWLHHGTEVHWLYSIGKRRFLYARAYKNKTFMNRRCKGLFILNDSVTITVTLTIGTFDLFDRHCDGQNGLHTHFAHQCNVCYGDCDGVAYCERALNAPWWNYCRIVSSLETI